MMLAIAGQESQWQNIQQIGGAARGFTQFELAGFEAVFNFDAPNGPVHQMAVFACDLAGLAPTAQAVYDVILDYPHLQMAFTRLLLWANRAPLPALGDVLGSFAYYVASWGPGLPAWSRWPTNYAAALAVTENKPVPALAYPPLYASRWLPRLIVP